MDGVSFYVPVQYVIDSAQPPAHMSCDWLKITHLFRPLIFPLEIYRKMEELKQCKAKAS